MSSNVPNWGPYVVPQDVYDAAVNAGAKYKIDPGILLGVGYYESGWNSNATNVNPNEQSYGWLQFNRQGGFGSGVPVEQLYNPQYEADVAASHIRRTLDSGSSLFDALWPWTNTRQRGLQLYQDVSNFSAVDPAGGGAAQVGGIHNTPVGQQPANVVAGATNALPNPLSGLDALGKFFADIENNSKRLAASVVAVVAIGVGVIVTTKGVTKR